jgi:Na+-transporting NADH:ubiquinone oxidoreductase subunit NqrC
MSSNEFKLLNHKLTMLEEKQKAQNIHLQHLKSFEAKQDKSNKYMIAEIKRTNDHIQDTVMPTIEKHITIYPQSKKECMK